jgi:hypothetical protein
MPLCINCGKKEVKEGVWLCPDCSRRVEKGFTPEGGQKHIQELRVSTRQSHSWFVRHLNWTLVFVWLISNGLVLWAVYPKPTPTQSELSSGLSIYVDEGCSNLWSSTNTPALVWVESTSETESPYEWQDANIVLYLKNNLGVPISVNADHSSEQILLGTTWVPKYAIPGFSISSDTVILEPHASTPINIKIHRCPVVLSFSPTTPSGTIYFHIYPIATESTNAMMITLIIIAAIAILSTEVWYLKQKRRSLLNLFWNLLSWIGFIIILRLENRAVSSLNEEGEEISLPQT